MEAQTAAGVWMEGYEALTAGCALVKAVGTDQISICGEDARRFVNGLVTCDVPEIKSGETAYGFMTNAQGRILADVVISASEECLVLDLPLGRAAAIDEHMLKYR
ncbi:MAG: hypothetical protein OEM62_12860, partial [Acidobacteriota bacterium]|nr:hypothetical protein [Acidobacteriota bacterium]